MSRKIDPGPCPQTCGCAYSEWLIARLKLYMERTRRSHALAVLLSHELDQVMREAPFDSDRERAIPGEGE